MGFKIFRVGHMSREEAKEYELAPFTFFITYNNNWYVGIFSVSVVLHYLKTLIEETMPLETCLATKAQYKSVRDDAAAQLITTQAVDEWTTLQNDVVAFYYDDIIYHIDKLNCS